ncbi:unnamed protein product [Cuscuta epithymum]|uniref:Uncharacterized protein n=1 Tax=Cuscuta epithymum TaxID=186058 RepID=A0AAV0EKA8_9ASTE|nr:unnamed protein product [Cuscuta epithymum]
MRFGDQGSISTVVSGRRSSVDKEQADKLCRSLGLIQQSSDINGGYHQSIQKHGY